MCVCVYVRACVCVCMCVCGITDDIFILLWQRSPGGHLLDGNDLLVYGQG